MRYWRAVAEGLRGGSDEYVQFRREYFDHLDRFIVECVHWPEGEAPTNYQLDLARLVHEHHRVAAKGPRRLGKTAFLALLILGFALTRDVDFDWKIVTTAGAGYQLTRYLWPEVHKWARRLNWAKIGRAPLVPDKELLKAALQLNTGQAFAVVPDRADLIEGAGAQQFLIIYDEAKSIPAQNFDAAEGAMASGGVHEDWETYAVAVSTPPTEKAGRFYEIFARKPGLTNWHPRSVSLEDAIEAGRVSAQWAADMLELWGEDNPLYQAHVLGNFSSAVDDKSVIPLWAIEKANERWFVWQETGEVLGDLTAVGVDVARKGLDRTVLAPRHGPIHPELRVYAKLELTQTTGLVKGVLDANAQGKAIIDSDGLGAGVTDSLREQGYKRRVIAFHGGHKTDLKDRSKELTFNNTRSAAWWKFREQLISENSEVALPPDDELTEELTAPTWWVESNAVLHVEGKRNSKDPDKDTIVERLGRSTDKADAVVMSWYTRPAGIFVG